MEWQRQAGGGPPHLKIYRENTAYLKAFRKGDQWHFLHLLHAEVLLTQRLSKFILKAQSVYTWIRSLNGIVPPSLLCFVLYIIMATDPSDGFFFIHTTYFLHRQLAHCHCSIYSRRHFFLPLVSGGSKAARMASSNTFLSPLWLKEQKKTRVKIRTLSAMSV